MKRLKEREVISMSYRSLLSFLSLSLFFTKSKEKRGEKERKKNDCVARRCSANCGSCSLRLKEGQKCVNVSEMKDEHPMEDLISKPTSDTPKFLPTTMFFLPFFLFFFQHAYFFAFSFSTFHVIPPGAGSPVVEGLQLVAYANVYRLIFAFVCTKVMTNDGCIEAQ